MFTIKKTTEKPLLARKEIEGEIIFEAKSTPSNDAVRKDVSAALKADEKAVVVKHIYTGYGTHIAKVLAFVYDSEESLKRVEPKHKDSKAKKAEGAEPAAK